MPASPRAQATGFDWGNVGRAARRWLPASTEDLASLVSNATGNRIATPRARSVGVGILVASIVAVLFWSLLAQTKTLRGLRRSTKKALSGLSDWFFGDEDDKEAWVEELR